MSALVVAQERVPATSPRALQAVRRLEQHLLQHEQQIPKTHHVLHGGVYSRTIMLPAGHALTGALVKIPTTLVVHGHASVLFGDGEERTLAGYHVLAASAGRKQAFIAHADTYITMSFATAARTIEQAEAEFTDEADRLLSRLGENEIIITED